MVLICQIQLKYTLQKNGDENFLCNISINLSCLITFVTLYYYFDNFMGFLCVCVCVCVCVCLFFPCLVFVPGLHSFDFCQYLGSLDYTEIGLTLFSGCIKYIQANKTKLRKIIYLPLHDSYTEWYFNRSVIWFMGCQNQFMMSGFRMVIYLSRVQCKEVDQG